LKQNRTGFCSLFPPVFFNRTGFTSFETAFEDVIEPGEPRQASRRLSLRFNISMQADQRNTSNFESTHSGQHREKAARMPIPPDRLQCTFAGTTAKMTWKLFFPTKDPAIARCLKT
jgi:hypothetical protein